MIRKATKEDIGAVEQSYTALLEHEAKNGSSSGWKLGVYPTRATAENAVGQGSLYVMEENGQICASMILNSEQPADYARVPWQYPAAADEVLVLHTLCVPPSQAGKGRGREMVAFAVDFGTSRGYKVFRLDTYDGNGPAAGLYTRMGFRLAGVAEVLFQDSIPEKQKFFEMCLG